VFDPRGPTLLELAVQALSSTDRGYDLLAPKFDYTPFRTPDPMLEACLPYLEQIAPARALDVCCGTGAAMRLLRRATSEIVAGVDRSTGMLAEARRRLHDSPGRARVSLVRGDALDLPFRSGTLDVATCFGAFGHILEHDEPRFCDEVARVLRPGGAFVFITTDAPPPTSPGFWLAHGFNAVMRVRNALMKPAFIMYYLTFLLPRARTLLEARGFRVAAHRQVCPPPYHHGIVVVATKGDRT
jgi:ubiquinone/menaquinone biosynthesis C-methylase UbiE